MCYGDPNHGKDGYYREWLESREREEPRRGVPAVDYQTEEEPDDG